MDSHNKNKKALVTVTLKMAFDLQEEHSYQLITRLEGSIHQHIAMGMLSADHPDDAILSDVEVSSDVEEV